MNTPWYFSTIDNHESGEWVAMEQLAEFSGAKIVSGVPPTDGNVIYLINLNLSFRGGDALAEHFASLMRNRNKVAFIIGVSRGWEELEVWRPLFEILKRISNVFFVGHPDQVRYLAEYGVEATLIHTNERRLAEQVNYAPGSILYTGFYWSEKNIPMFLETARLLPEWRFTIQIGMNQQLSQNLLSGNVTTESRFLPADRYLRYLAGFEYIWLPRTNSPWIYAGRSGVTAIASGRPAILTDVEPNRMIPPNAAIKYPADWTAERIAELIRSRPIPDPHGVKQFLDEVSPERVWGIMKERMLKSN